jgi:hypothetical protein
VLIVCHVITTVITSQGFRDELKSFTCIKALIGAANHELRSCLFDSVHFGPWKLETQFFWVGSYGGGLHRIHSAHGENQEKRERNSCGKNYCIRRR